MFGMVKLGLACGRAAQTWMHDDEGLGWALPTKRATKRGTTAQNYLTISMCYGERGGIPSPAPNGFNGWDTTPPMGGAVLSASIRSRCIRRTHCLGKSRSLVLRRLS